MITSTVTPKIDIKLEKNTKGFNFEIKLNQADATSEAEIDKAIALLDYAQAQMTQRYGAASVNGGEK